MKDLSLICPSCGSPSVDYSELANGNASCRICKWEGRREELVGVAFEHMFGSREGIAMELFNDVRRLMSDKIFMLGLAKFLSRWGFIDVQGDPKKVAYRLSRYGAAMARAMLKAVIEEREALEKENHERRAESAKS